MQYRLCICCIKSLFLLFLCLFYYKMTLLTLNCQPAKYYKHDLCCWKANDEKVGSSPALQVSKSRLPRTHEIHSFDVLSPVCVTHAGCLVLSGLRTLPRLCSGTVGNPDRHLQNSRLNPAVALKRPRGRQQWWDVFRQRQNLRQWKSVDGCVWMFSVFRTTFLRATWSMSRP